MLFTLCFVAIFNGISPIIGALLSKNILNELQGVIQAGGLAESAFWTSPVLYLLFFLFVYRLAVAVIRNISSAVNRIAGEKVVRQVKTQIMEKSLELDLGSFDDPAVRPGLWWATLIIIAVSIPSAVINYIYRRKNFRYMRFRSKERRKTNYYSSVLVDKDRIKEVRMFDLGDTFIGRFQQAFLEYYQGMRNLILAESGWHIAISLVSCCTNLVFYLLIAKQVFTGQILIGDYSLYTGALPLLPPLSVPLSPPLRWCTKAHCSLITSSYS